MDTKSFTFGTTADLYLKEILGKIMKQEWEVDNRAKWKDGTPVMTKRIFGIQHEYDLSVEFPATTLRPSFVKTAFEEVDWTYVRRDNNINNLNAKIWNEWADEDGSIGKTYGYQVGQPILGFDNQMDFVLHEVVHNPTSRRIMIELWNVKDLPEMNLPPCVHNLQFFVQNGKLDLMVKQRSQDFITAWNFDVVMFAILNIMVAKHAGLEPGRLIHTIGDCHVYNKYEDIALELLKRPTLPTPAFIFNQEKTDFYSWTADDFKLIYADRPVLKIPDIAI